ncbi:uncharacterized protein [Rutidosis leptorrhynchoides]|uniref:uncharacterized protein isoform X2 n=1 Tax=Rutidosis leptorrhynchoides TaxID=125765 RepID=UPI003A9A0357
MYLATGFGIDVISGVKHEPNVYDEEYYKMMVMQDPCNPLFSKNYAQFLQSEGDVTGAEEYYLRAIKQDPKDGEILMQYGKLIWELHCDQDRALSYFEKAVVAAPGDSIILAAYASFLWEKEQVQDKDHDQVIKGDWACSDGC